VYYGERARPVNKPPAYPTMLAPTPRTGKHMHASMRALGSTSSNFVHDLDHPSTHATNMRCASEYRDQHNQSASLPRTQPWLPPTPRTGQTCALLASNDARARIHFQQFCARPGPPAHPRATSMRWAGESGAGKHMHATCQQRRALRSTSSNLRATLATRAPTRDHYALGQ
jgi:hypothetical protein